VKRSSEIYRDFAENEGAVPVVVGRKSRIERFAGALHTYTMEAMMGDKKALQAGTTWGRILPKRSVFNSWMRTTNCNTHGKHRGG